MVDKFFPPRVEEFFNLFSPLNPLQIHYNRELNGLVYEVNSLRVEPQFTVIFRFGNRTFEVGKNMNRIFTFVGPCIFSGLSLKS